MSNVVVSLTDLGRQMEAQALLYGYAFRIDYFVVGSGGHDPGNPVLALPLDLTVTSLPGQFFGPKPIDGKALVTSTCPQWTCILQPGEGVGQISNIGLIATNVFVPNFSINLAPEAVFAGTSGQTFSPAYVNFPTANTITISNHGFNNGDAVVLASTGTLPGGLNNTSIFYIELIDANSFMLSLSVSGSPVTLSNQGSGTHSIRLASDDTFTYTSHGLTNGTRVDVTTTNTVPGGLVAGQIYYVVFATANTFKLSTTLNGAPIDITSSGSGVLTVTDLDSLPPGAPTVGSTFLYALTNFPAAYKVSASRQTYFVTLQT